MNKIEVELETDFLLPKASFWTGVGSIFNLTGNYYEFNTSKTAAEADAKALKSDWDNVGCDIKRATKKFKEENPSLMCLNE